MTMADTKYALLSVSDKTNLAELAENLVALNYHLIASGGTAKMLLERGLPVKEVSDVTKAPEMLGGRVKTLHPAIHGGILARADLASDVQDMAQRGYDFIDTVVCNLYPFTATVARPNVTLADAVENIDIGGVTLLRAAAKNHARVSILCDPSDYAAFIHNLRSEGVTPALRQKLALKAFHHTAEYDAAISEYFDRTFAADNYLPLRYGCNPHQTPAAVTSAAGGAPLPFSVLAGSPGYINLLDALNAWPLVKELAAATDLPAAASFKHVSPAGAAIGGLGLSRDEAVALAVDDLLGDLTPVAEAYAKARGADRMASFGDWIALSHPCDDITAKLISREVSDGIIAPGYTPGALEVLRKKKGGKFTILQMDPAYEPPAAEVRQVYGIHMHQRRNDATFSPRSFDRVVAGSEVPPAVARDMIVASVALKYTQSNSVCFVKNGMVVGLGAGQQSRIHCTRLAGGKADVWWCRHHPRVLRYAQSFRPGTTRPVKANALEAMVTGEVDDLAEWQGLFELGGDVPALLTAEERAAWMKELSGVVCGSDAFFPFSDNVDRAKRSGVSWIVAPSGSVADDQVVAKATSYGMGYVFTDTRLFHH